MNTAGAATVLVTVLALLFLVGVSLAAYAQGRAERRRLRRGGLIEPDVFRRRA